MAKSYFRNALDNMIAARERQVRRYVNGTLLGLDDETLKSYGRTREDTRKEGFQNFGM